MGPWPEPLAISEEVDELPNSEVPRGFLCPITQAIMRQPALLLHDATVTPSTYEKEAISQWLAEHRCAAQGKCGAVQQMPRSAALCIGRCRKVAVRWGRAGLDQAAASISEVNRC